MKNVILISFLLFIVPFKVFSQLDIQAHGVVPTEKGNFIYLGETIPRGFTYRLERSISGSGKFEKVADITAPSDREEFDENRHKYAEYFENNPRMKDIEADYIWKQFQEGKPIESIIYLNHVMTYLGVGLAYFDPIDTRTNECIYKVSVVFENGNISNVTELRSQLLPKKIIFPEIFNEKSELVGGKIIITWRLAARDNFAAFNIYRRPYAEGEYLKVNSEELNAFIRSEEGIYYVELMEEINDEAVWNEYLIAPVDVYGREGERQAHTEGGNIKDRYIPPFMEADAISDKEGHTVKLSWSYEMKDYLTGLSILRSENYDDGFTRIVTLEPTDTTYTDILPVTGENYYYRLILHGVDGEKNESPTIFVAYLGSSDAPSPPKRIDAEPIEDGIMVTWDDSESPFQIGYFVYRRSSALQEFKQVSNLIPVEAENYTYIDTSGLLKGATFYEYVVKTFNQDSQLSENSDTVMTYADIPIELKTPGDLRYNRSGDMVYVFWEDLALDDEYILGYKVFRKFNDGEWIMMNRDTIEPRKSFYQDTTLSEAGIYTYGIAAWDAFGNQSAMAEISIIKEEKPLLPPPTGINAMQTSEGIYIRWGQMNGDISGFNIYRSELEGNPQLIGNVTADDLDFLDKEAKEDILYLYQVTTIDINGRESEKSDAEILKIN